MTRRAFFQAIPGVLPLCHPSQLPPALSLSFQEYEGVAALLTAGPATSEVARNKATAILRAAVREAGPQVQHRREQ